MSVTVVTSTVADGSMLNRYDYLDTPVIENRKAFFKKHDIPFENATRVNPTTHTRALVLHETDWLQYKETGLNERGDGMDNAAITIADALVTTEIGHALLLPIADCVGAVLYDPKHSVLAVAHLGRHSLEQNGAHEIVRYLAQKHESNPGDLQVWLTPAPSKANYPIWALDNKGMKEVTFEQLDAAGVLESNITDNTAESDTDTNYYSYSEFLKGNRTENGDYAIVAVMNN